MLKFTVYDKYVLCYVELRSLVCTGSCCLFQAIWNKTGKATLRSCLHINTFFIFDKNILEKKISSFVKKYSLLWKNILLSEKISFVKKILFCEKISFFVKNYSFIWKNILICEKTVLFCERISSFWKNILLEKII